tara:strand:- start:2970 stop:3293 length:324 start_codon:yes stop_codon:yes gene_type:complete
MANKLQLRGGTTAEHATFTGALREVTVDTDKSVLVVHDGVTAGGYPAEGSAEVYGFHVDATGNLSVTTTNKGEDSISEATYATFEDVIYASSNMSWSLFGTNLRVTI